MAFSHPTPVLASRTLLALAFLGAVTGKGALAAADSEEARQARADCHLEAEAAGLKGSELDSFVDECVADLLSVQLENVLQD